jgi:hypothetical protein
VLGKDGRESAVARAASFEDPTMAKELKGRRIAILATDGFEQAELETPRIALFEAGAAVDVIAPKTGRIQGMRHHEKGDAIVVDKSLDRRKPPTMKRSSCPAGSRIRMRCAWNRRRSPSFVIS